MILRSKATMAIGLIGGSAFTVAVLSAAADRIEKPAVPAVQLVGHSSKIAEERFVLIKDEAAWAKLWAEHSGVEAAGAMSRHNAPKVDFSRFMVVGAFRGATVNEDGEVAESILDNKDAVRVRYEPSTFQTASFGPGEDKGERTSPFGLWVVERTDKPVLLERGERSLKSEPLRWVEVKRFGTTK